jgi:AbrB family looped-hinge helix DNA binding protein
MAGKFPKDKYAWTVKIGEKGQFVIPREAREVFDLNPGDTIIVLGDKKRGLAIPPKSSFAELAARIFGADPSGEDEK